MAHPRQRFLISALLKRLTFTPVMAIQGARQTGKSFLVRDLLPSKLPGLIYRTFDDDQTRQSAARLPNEFLDRYSEAKPLVIDEAQKVPNIFDAVKLKVDRKREAGKFLLLGSTEFSHLSKIRESLTGRMGRLRLFPFTVSESLHLPLAAWNSNLWIPMRDRPRVEREDFIRYLDRGGLPGIFHIRSEFERTQLTKDWIDLLTERDIHQFPKIKLDSNLCRQILKLLASLDEPEAGVIAKILKKDLRRIKIHLHALKELFVVNEILPHRLGSGKPLYFLLDPAVAKFLGASFERQLQVWLLNEVLAYQSYHLHASEPLQFYRTSRGTRIDLVIDSSKFCVAIKIFDGNRITKKDIGILKAFRDKVGKKNVHTIGLAPGEFSFKSEKVPVLPWEVLL